VTETREMSMVHLIQERVRPGLLRRLRNLLEMRNLATHQQQTLPQLDRDVADRVEI
jgi:hypothetical protein